MIYLMCNRTCHIKLNFDFPYDVVRSLSLRRNTYTSTKVMSSEREYDLK